MSKNALIVGIDHYDNNTDFSQLNGCVKDARDIHQKLENHGTEEPNFSNPKLILGEKSKKVIERGELKDSIVKLFKKQGEIALFYFSGHGYLDDNGGFLVTGESSRGDDGVSIFELMHIANKSEAENVVIILDCCHSGTAALNPLMSEISEIRKGVSIITACGPTQIAGGLRSGGFFTQQLVEALDGAAANLLGDITLNSVYAYVEKFFNFSRQRPEFKANVDSLVTLRKVMPQITDQELNSFANLFLTDTSINLDPTYISEKVRTEYSIRFATLSPPPHPDRVKDFLILEKSASLNLLTSFIEGENLRDMAIYGRSCKLTKLGEFYRDLILYGHNRK